MDINKLLEDYLDRPKWAGKLFMKDEKTCYVDGLIDGAAEILVENDLLKGKIKHVSQKLSKILSEYEVGNYDYDNYRFYSDVFVIFDELLVLSE